MAAVERVQNANFDVRAPSGSRRSSGDPIRKSVRRTAARDGALSILAVLGSVALRAAKSVSVPFAHG